MPPSTSSPPRRGRPPVLTRELVEDTAYSLVAERGYDSVSMRELAQRLGVSAMAVQRVSGGRDALDDALVTRLVEAERRPDRQWPDDWERSLHEYAQLLRKFCRRHPAVLRALARRPLDSPFAQELVDRVLASLIAAGFTPLMAAEIFLAIRDYVTGHAHVEAHRVPGRRPRLSPDLEYLQMAAPHLSEPDHDAQFAIGLDLLIAGAAAKLAGSPCPTASGSTTRESG